MGQYATGDVLLASVRLNGHNNRKIRPLVVLKSRPGGFLEVCPVSSKPSSDVPSLVLTPDDFLEGGLDICRESHILITFSLVIKTRDVLAKKGRVGPDVLHSLHILRQGFGKK